MDAVKLIELEEGKFYTIQTNSRLEKIPYKEIYYIERDGKNASITAAGGISRVRKSLKQVYEELGAEEFIYIDRGCLVFRMNRQYEVEKELARLISEQAELLERDYTTLNNAYAVNAKLFHDFHNHIGALRQLLSHEKYAEAVQYLDELQAPVQEMCSFFAAYRYRSAVSLAP